MSRILQVWIDDDTERRLTHASLTLDRGIEDLAENAVAESALDWEKRSMPRVKPEGTK